MTPAYAYLRVSGRSQLDGDGFPRQREACTKYAVANDLEIVATFYEEAIPGKTELENRPALNRLYEALNGNGVRTIIIERLDRLARDLLVQETIIADLRKHGYTIISTCEPDLCSDDPSRKLMRQIFGAIAEYDKAMIVLKLRGARQRNKQKNGRCEGVKPFGYFPNEKSTLAAIFALRDQGQDSVQIALRLNSDGIHSTRSGKRWHPSVIRKILSRKMEFSQNCT